MMAILQRAYSDEQKLKRQEGILLAVERLFRERRYEKVTMLDIAEKSGVSKGTLYVYFRTKESLFLSYATRKIDRFFGLLLMNLSAFHEPAGVAGVVEALGQSYAESKDMVRLLPLLHHVLESKAGFDNALSFRQGLIPLLERAGVEIERHLVFLDQGAGKRLLLTIHSLSLGLQQLADLSPDLQKMKQHPGMDIYTFEFEDSFLNTVDLLLAGMEVRAGSRNLKANSQKRRHQ